MMSTTKLKVQAKPPEKDQATATGNMHRKLVEFGHVVPEICMPTNRQTDTHITTLHSPTGSELTTQIQLPILADRAIYFTF